MSRLARLFASDEALAPEYVDAIETRGPSAKSSSLPDHPWDAIVIGAGPAGAATAAHLARRGRAVLMVDRDRYPRSKPCGGCLNQTAVAAIRALDVRPSDVGMLPLRRFEAHYRGRTAAWTLRGGGIVDRARFDAVLVARAMEAGAWFLPNTRARVGPPSPGARTVFIHCADGWLPVAGRAVVLATGTAQPPIAEPRLRRRAVADSRVGLHAIAPAWAIDVPADTILMAFGASGYIGCTRRADGSIALAAACDPHAMAAEGPEAWARATIEASGLACRPNGLAELAWRGTPPLTGRPRTVAAERLFVVGDAAGYIEPLTGEGIGWALAGAAELAAVVESVAARWTPAHAYRWQRLHGRTRRAQHACRVAATVARHHALMQSSSAMLTRTPGLLRPILQLVHAG